MTAKKDDIKDLPQWPRLLSLPQAAAYAGVSPTAFLKHFPHINRIHIGRAVRYDRLQIDKAINLILEADEFGVPTINTAAILEQL